MINHLEKIIENIKSNKKISGKILKNINFDISYYETYNTDNKLAICYMIANNLNTTPKCNICNIQTVNFISVNKGFRLYCLKCSRIKTSERNKTNNNILNKKIKEEVKQKMSIARKLYWKNKKEGLVNGD